jgi:hypothetical protein
VRQKPGIVVHTYHPNYTRRVTRKIAIQTHPGIKEAIPKVTKAKKRAGDIAYMV